MQDEIVKSLDVFWGQTKVGSYEKFQSGSEQFVYDAAYLAQTGCQPISVRRLDGCRSRSTRWMAAR